MSVNRRLSNIEATIAQQHRHASRCDTCRDWSDIRLATVDATGVVIDEDRPARCPGCGFESDSRGMVRSIVVVVPSGVVA